MHNFKELIDKESKKLRQMHLDVHLTYSERKRYPEKWKKACHVFHNYISEIDPYINRVYEEELMDTILQEFVIVFLERNPMFFRSGYIKQIMLTKIKRAPLKKYQKERLKLVVLNAVDSRPYREYRYYCRLAMSLLDIELISAVKYKIENGKGSKRSRAKMMFKYFI